MGQGLARQGERSVALVGTYPPTACGVATFTANLRTAIAPSGSSWRAGVVRILDRWEPPPAEEVVGQWVTGDPASFTPIRATLNSFSAVILQHEYGLFGGRDGEDVLELLDGLEVPLVTVLHTVLREPSAHQREILDELLERATPTVVTSEAARRRIVEVHRANPDAIVVVPHGAVRNFSGPTLQSVPRPAVLTWGLLGPGKGIEFGIEALARVTAPLRPPTYIVAGQTHPKVRAREGERYREGLRARARSLGLGERVHLDDGYRDWDALRALVRSVDVVLLPYQSREQVSSGVLVEALASGKPVVATRFPHAEELLGNGAGICVDHEDVHAMADALARVLYEPGLADRMAFDARRIASRLLWPRVGRSYRALLSGLIAARGVA